LFHNVFSHGVAGLEASESSGADFFMSVFEEDGFVNNSNDIFIPGKGNFVSLFVSFLKLLRAVLSDGNRHEVTLSVGGKSLHLEALEEFHLVHESVEGKSPSFSDSLEEFSLHFIKNEFGVFLSSFNFLSIFLDKSVLNRTFAFFSDDSIIHHVFKEHLDRLFDCLVCSVDRESRVLRDVVRSIDSSEVRHSSTTNFLVEALRISLFTGFDRGGDVSLEELQVSCLVSSFRYVSGSLLGGNERTENNLSGLVEKLRDFTNTADVFCAIFSGKSKTFVHSLTDNISIETEDASSVS
jgi:hypothetical protein